ncbi:MAG: hypothetical protein J6V66_00750 [Clostridia bacterium]|nr:hypothetical protein [Clostridia bacterium]
MNFPYSDDYMTYDYTLHRYVLTEKDILDNFAINMTARFKNANTVHTVLKQVSMQVYNYIHEYNVNTEIQDYIIAKTEKGREIIKQAMEQQLLYWLTVGDLTRSTDKDKRAVWFDDNAREILYQGIPEIGTPIVYTGSLYFKSCDNTEW